MIIVLVIRKVDQKDGCEHPIGKTWHLVQEQCVPIICKLVWNSLVAEFVLDLESEKTYASFLQETRQS